MADLKTYAKAYRQDQEFVSVFPSLTDMSFFWEPIQQSIMLPPGYQVTLTKPNEASSVILLLLSFATKQFVADSDLPPKDWSINLSWILNSCHELLDSFMALMKSRSLDRRKIVICLSRVVHCALRTDSQLLIQRSTNLMARILKILKSADGMVVQDLLGESIAMLQIKTPKVTHVLKSAILRIMDNPETWSKFMDNFQVRILDCFWEVTYRI
jgi:hypothetical protein